MVHSIYIETSPLIDPNMDAPVVFPPDVKTSDKRLSLRESLSRMLRLSSSSGDRASVLEDKRVRKCSSVSTSISRSSGSRRASRVQIVTDTDDHSRSNTADQQDKHTQQLTGTEDRAASSSRSRVPPGGHPLDPSTPGGHQQLAKDQPHHAVDQPRHDEAAPPHDDTAPPHDDTASPHDDDNSVAPATTGASWFRGVYSTIVDQVTNSIPISSLGMKRNEYKKDVVFNVEGELFVASSTALKELGSDSPLFQMVSAAPGASDVYPRNEQGQYMICRPSPQFQLVLDFVHHGHCKYPTTGSDAWVELFHDATFFKAHALLREMERAEASLFERDRERIRIAMLKVQFMKAKRVLEQKQSEKQYAYNVLIAGVTGTGKSSTLNTILDEQACVISGAQAQGTRGTELRDGVIDDKHYMSYIDTQGLGADTSISDEELLAQIMTSAESIRSMGIINNVLISFDTSSRTTPSMMANQLTLMELFSEIKRSCFLCFTKWNCNSVISEWNHPLKKWVRKWRRMDDITEITQDPPSYKEMYLAYCKYLMKTMVNGQDGGAFAKIVTFLSFFESRVVWMFNLDAVQIEDREDGELEPHVLKMYEFYRNESLKVLYDGSTVIPTKDLIFLKGSRDTMLGVAKSLIRMRNRKITQLELVGLQKDKRKVIRAIFDSEKDDIAKRIEDRDYESSDEFTNQIATLAGVVREGAYVGCAMQ